VVVSFIGGGKQSKTTDLSQVIDEEVRINFTKQKYVNDMPIIKSHIS
jgi:hypothetical protein